MNLFSLIYYVIAMSSLFCYGKLLWVHGLDFFKSEYFLKTRLPYFHIGLSLHFLLLIFLAWLNDRCPLGNSAEALLFFSGIFAVVYIVPYSIHNQRELAFFFLLPIVTTSFISLLLIQPISETLTLQNSYFSFHIILSLFAYCSLTISVLFSLMYLLLFKKLKERHFDNVFQKLPSLKEQDKSSIIWLLVGVGFMLLASLLGRIWVIQSNLNSSGIVALIILIVLVAFVMNALARAVRLIPISWFHRLNFVLLLFLVLVQVFGVHGFN